MQPLYICLVNPFPSFLPLPLPPLSFFGSRFISRAVKTENLVPRSFFASKPNGNACYAGYFSHSFRDSPTHFPGFLSLYHDLSIVFSSGMRGEEIIKSNRAKELSFFSLLSLPLPISPKTYDTQCNIGSKLEDFDDDL